MKQVQPFLPSVPLSFRLSWRFLGIASLVFSKFWHVARNSYEFVRNIAGFSRKKILPSKLGKWTKNWPKTGVFEFIEKFCNQFLLNLFYNERFHYLLCSCTNPIFEKNYVSEILAEMFSANQIAGFFYQSYVQNKSINQSYFLYINTNSHKLKVDQKVLEWA